MKNFDWTSFTKRIAVKSTLPEIYDAWTKAAAIESWFLEKVVFQRNSEPIGPDASVENNDEYEWLWYLYDDAMRGEIKQANGKDFIQFTFEGSCLVDVALEQKNEYVIVTLKQHNIPTDDQSMQFVRLGCTNGWTFYLANLKSVYEGGIDLRNKDGELGPMINN